MKDLRFSIISVTIMFLALVLEHHSNVVKIQEKDDLIFSLQTINENLTYELGECHLLVSSENIIKIE